MQLTVTVTVPSLSGPTPPLHHTDHALRVFHLVSAASTAQPQDEYTVHLSCFMKCVGPLDNPECAKRDYVPRAADTQVLVSMPKITPLLVNLSLILGPDHSFMSSICHAS